ncbi:MAG: glycogen debranching protein GlgX [Actinomycetota bacterium]|nr:glycogen debranching protein GlgX [Actinomycetota bacterium]
MSPGDHPLGATPTSDGVWFAVHSPTAEYVEVCIDGPDGEACHRLTDQTGPIHRGLVRGVAMGTRYGFRAHGEGHRPSKFLLDPRARAVSGHVDWHPALRTDDDQDSAPHMPRSVVVGPPSTTPTPPIRIPWAQTVIYEMHIKGISQTHPEVSPELRGTYAGLASEPIIAHLLRLGVTTIELLPISQFVHEEYLLERGLRQYWGYMPITPFAPHAEYAMSETPQGVVDEVGSMITALHEAGLEVVIDVVLNHTGEGGKTGPWLSFRGLDDRGYYRHGHDGDYDDVTGTGNTLDLGSAPVHDLALDSLRHWASTYQVDGFRFDLASALLRGSQGESRFLEEVAADPLLSSLKLIAEPWDMGHDGYRLGGFPQPWREWNDRFRDTVRDAWKATPGMLPELATRALGSSDIFAPERPPTSSINFVTAHDGPTLADLVTYQESHNEANGEDHYPTHNQHAWNTGIEGPTDDTEITELRNRRRRSMLATLLLANGVPMLLGGDELGRTQQGNTNVYCQDSPMSWFDWSTVDEELIEFTARLIRLRQSARKIVGQSWFNGTKGHVGPLEGEWFGVDGEPVANWHDHGLSTLVLQVSGEPDLLFVANTGLDPDLVTLPHGEWATILDTSDPTVEDRQEGDSVNVDPLALLLLKCTSSSPPQS